MRIYTILTVTLISLLLNGCILDRIKQRMAAKQQIEKQRQQTMNKKKLGQEVLKKEKVYTPSKATAPIYANPNNIEVSHKTVKKISQVKKSKKHKHITKVKKVIPEPYSIKKGDSDPELLGPQTTLKSNPLTINKKIEKSNKKSKG